MTEKRKVRYAVAGLGHIAQVAVLPAFKHALENCELTAFISDDQEKINELSDRYGVTYAWSYNQLSEAYSSGVFDAVFIALPNDMHREFTVKAADHGLHVLCEKPMALTSADCLAMIEAAERNSVKLMVAYRLHFEKTNMTAVDLIKQGKIGNPRLFNSSFTMQVREGNIRTQAERGGGPLNDIGIYCINASRYLFQEEPLEVVSIAARSQDSRFAEIEESISAVLKFPDEKLAAFACSFGATNVQRYEVIGTEGSIALDPAYEYAAELEYVLKVGEKEQRHKTPKRDQFAPELIYFAKCILENKEPRPSGYEGLNDILVIEAIRESATTGKKVAVKSSPRASHPDRTLIREKPGVAKPPMVNVQSGAK